MKMLRRAVGILLLLVLVAGAVFYLRPTWVLDQRTHLRLWYHHVDSKYINLGPYRIHFFEAQAARGTPGIPLLLIHGLGSRGEDWAPLIPGFAAHGFHVYAPDLLGYGRSSRPDVSYSISLEESMVLDYMRAMHLERADVIGWSMGGWVAMKIALDHPERVNRLAIYDSAGTYFPAAFPLNLFTPSTPDGVQQLFDVLEPKPKPIPRFVLRDILRRIRQNAWIVNRSMSQMAGGRSLLDFRLAAMRPPMLVMWGGSDHLIPVSVAQYIHRLVPHSVLEVVEGCGHLGPGECSAAYLTGTVEFLRAEPPMQGGEKTLPHPE